MAKCSNRRSARIPIKATHLETHRFVGGGGFVPNIIFNPSQKGLAFARTDIGGAYRLNSDDTWTPLTDFANDTTWCAFFPSPNLRM